MRFKTKYECNIITPLFMGSANPQQAELRTPSFKGGLRFWWRAINGNLSSEKMREKEAELFGSSDENIGKSHLILRIPAKRMRTGRDSPVPHRKGNQNKTYFESPSIKKGQSFEFLLTSIGNETEHKEYQAIFELVLQLGGFGKRSRRGFGSIEIIKKDGGEYNSPVDATNLLNLLQIINPGQFSLSPDGRRVLSKNFSGNYPYIKEIEIGKAYNNVDILLKTICQAASTYICAYLGTIGDGSRFASPIYVSVIKCNDIYRPIITTLNTSFDPKKLHLKGSPNNQMAFKGAIL